MTALLTSGRIQGHPFLRGCSDEFLNHLQEFCTESSFETGEVIFHQNDYADRFFLILDGTVELVVECDDGTTIFVQELPSGDVLGWSWLFPPFTWHFTARAVEPCNVLALNGASLLIRAEEDPRFGYELMKRVNQQIVHRLQATRARLIEETAPR